MLTRVSILLLLAMFVFACQPAASTEQEEKQTETPKAEKAEVAKKYKLTPFSVSTAYPDAKIEDMTYKNGTVKIPYSATNYVLGAQTPDAGSKMCANSGKGQHIHFIVNNGPYAAHYTNEFGADLPDGEHYILAFLSRSYHESIKTEAAHILKKVTIADKSMTASEDVDDAMLLYSRPKGTYVGKANTNKVMLDFYVANADLGDSYRVKADINGEEHIIDSWSPYYIEGLPMGKNKITLTLIDAAGKPYDIPLNPVTREFELKPDPTES